MGLTRDASFSRLLEYIYFGATPIVNDVIYRVQEYYNSGFLLHRDDSKLIQLVIRRLTSLWDADDLMNAVGIILADIFHDCRSDHGELSPVIARDRFGLLAELLLDRLLQG